MKRELSSVFNRETAPLILIIFAYFIISPLLSYAYDEGYYFQFFRWMYLYNVQPYRIWVFGAFYNTINIGSLSLNVPFYTLGIDNVLVQQFTEKLPLVISAIFVGFGIDIIINSSKNIEKSWTSPILFFLMLPVCIFYVDFIGNALIVALFFLIFSFVFLSKAKPRVASLFLGASAATYLYPIFFILPFSKFAKIEYGKKTMQQSVIIFFITIAVGQILPLIISILTRTPYSDTILSAILSKYSSVTVTSSVQSPYGIYYILSLFHFEASAALKEIIFLLAMLVPAVMFFSYKFEKINYGNLIEFSYLESLVFILFSITALPQYLLAIAPFSVILFYQYKNRSYISGLTIAFFLGLLLFFVNNTPILYLLSNINPTWQYSPKFILPQYYVTLLSIFYTISLLSLLVLHLVNSRIRNAVNLKDQIKDYKKKEKNPIRIHACFMKLKLAGFFLIISLIIVLIAPAFNHVPSVMLFTQQASSGTSIAAKVNTNNDFTSYTVEKPTIWSLINNYSRSHGTFNLEIPMGNFGNLSENSLPRTIYNQSQGLSVTLSSSANPININQTLFLSSNVTGGVPPYNFTWYIGSEQGQSKQNQTISFGYLGNYSIILVVTDSKEHNVTVYLNEEVGSYYYNISFNSKPLGIFNSSNLQSVLVNSSYIKEVNYVNLSAAFTSKGNIHLQFNLPLKVPPQEIYNNLTYLITGFFFSLITVSGLVTITWFLRKNYIR